MGKLARVLRSGIFPATETVLIVESDPVLRRLEESALSRKYRIIQTSGPDQAVRVAARHRSDLDLLLTAVRFPHMDGWELTELLKLDYPKLKAVYVSASMDTSKARTFPCAIIVLEKDGFSADRLRQAVHDTLEGTFPNKTDSPFSLHGWAKPPI